MKTNVEVQKNINEAPVSLIRRFSRRVKSSNTLQKVRSKRFYSRKDSSLKTKDRALNRISKTKEYEHLKKLGKIPG
ncbi:MAG: hypothetical protein KAI72_07225 [Candidatus Pacebacteria bacterium]|nr:hypothetical protein [Candidatus Paceibacterota bacterium]